MMTSPIEQTKRCLVLFWVLALIGVGAPHQACATDAATRPWAALLDCRGVLDDSVRLACFDRESARAVASSAVPATPVVFGLSPAKIDAQQPAVKRAEPSAMEGRVAELRFGADGHLRVTLDSGQVWRQLATDESLALTVGETVRISAAALGSFWLRTPSGRGAKVSRLR